MRKSIDLIKLKADLSAIETEDEFLDIFEIFEEYFKDVSMACGDDFSIVMANKMEEIVNFIKKGG